MFTHRRPLRVGTDCSGIEAPIQALKQLRILFSHEFSSEIDKHCIASIRANYHPKILYGDMMERDLKTVPDIDLYVCGFPCQPFSIAGSRQGVHDPRGTVFWECLRVLQFKEPAMFVLENVKGLLSIDGGIVFQTIMSELDKLTEYHVNWKVLTTSDYGIPQSRQRVFIVGIKKKVMKKAFEWPEPIPLNKRQSLKSFIDRKDVRQDMPTPRQQSLVNRVPIEACFVNFSFQNNSVSNSNVMCPTITANCKLWCVPMHRYANIKEHLKLQGFSTYFKQVVSDAQMKKQIGNSMSVNLVKALLKVMIECIDKSKL